MLTTKTRQTILHSITDIMVVAVDVMDMDKDKAECTTSRILTVRRPRYRESSYWVLRGIYGRHGRLYTKHVTRY